jgi:zinc resistance-associated protein
MKRTMMIIGALFLVGAIAYPVLAWGPGWGGMYRGMGWGNGPMYGGNSGYGYGTLDKEQASKLDQLRQKFFNDTTGLRNDLWNKSRELDSVLNTENPDRGKAEALQNEINGLRAQLSQKGSDFQLETRKIVPNAESGEGYGPGMMGYGYGLGMMGYGQHMGGFGGGCWN